MTVFHGEFSKKKLDKSIVKKSITLGPLFNWLHFLQDSLSLTLLKAMIKRMTKRTVGNISSPPSSWGMLIELHPLDSSHLPVQWPNRISLSARIVESSNKWQRRLQANSIQPQFQKESNSVNGLSAHCFDLFVCEKKYHHILQCVDLQLINNIEKGEEFNWKVKQIILCCRQCDGRQYCNFHGFDDLNSFLHDLQSFITLASTFKS